MPTPSVSMLLFVLAAGLGLGALLPWIARWPRRGLASLVLAALAAAALGGGMALRVAPATQLAERAYALAMAQQRRWEGEPLALLARARAIDPLDPKALALSGTAAFDRRDYRQALAHWELLARTQAPGSLYAQRVQPSIAEARRLAGLTAPMVADGAASGSAASRTR